MLRVAVAPLPRGAPSTGRHRNVGVSLGAMHCQHHCPRGGIGGNASAVSCLINRRQGYVHASPAESTGCLVCVVASIGWVAHRSGPTEGWCCRSMDAEGNTPEGRARTVSASGPLFW